jgi:hypothetical protein
MYSGKKMFRVHLFYIQATIRRALNRQRSDSVR